MVELSHWWVSVVYMGAKYPMIGSSILSYSFIAVSHFAKRCAWNQLVMYNILLHCWWIQGDRIIAIITTQFIWEWSQGQAAKHWNIMRKDIGPKFQNLWQIWYRYTNLVSKDFSLPLLSLGCYERIRIIFSSRSCLFHQYTKFPSWVHSGLVPTFRRSD